MSSNATPAEPIRVEMLMLTVYRFIRWILLDFDHLVICNDMVEFNGKRVEQDLCVRISFNIISRLIQFFDNRLLLRDSCKFVEATGKVVFVSRNVQTN